MENKKIKNATEHIYDDIHFKSGLEVDIYKLLCKEGFNPKYEDRTYRVWQGKKFQVPCYDLHKDRKLKKNVWGINQYKPVDIKYTPDFTFHIVDKEGVLRLIVIEGKGYPNDRYVYVKKMFRSYLEKYHPESLFFEVHNLKQTKAAIEIINSIKQ